MNQFLNKFSLHKILFLFLLFLPASILVAADTDFLKTYLALDRGNSVQLPPHFRSTYQLDRNNNDVNWDGLTDLRISAGGQLSKLNLEKMLNYLHTKQLVIIDLRQESHGFLNGNAISWFAPHNAINANKKDEQIEQDQASLLGSLENQEYVTVNKIIQKTPDDIVKNVKPVEFAVHNISSEESVAADYHLNYYRLYVQDFHAPSEKQVDRFIKVVNRISKDKWIFFHCRAGRGRSTTFMVMYDMLHNAKKVSFEDILKRQAKLGGINLQNLPPKHSYKYPFALERLNFIKQFYVYAKDNNDNFHTSWSQWLKTHI